MANYFEPAQTGANGEIIFGGVPNMSNYGGVGGVPNRLISDFEFATMIQAAKSANVSDTVSAAADNSGFRATVKPTDVMSKMDLIEVYAMRMDTATICHNVVNFFKPMFADVESANIAIEDGRPVATIYFSSTYVPKEIEVDGKKMTEPVAFSNTIATKVNDPINQAIQMQAAATTGVVTMSKEAKAVFGEYIGNKIDIAKCTSRIYDTIGNRFVMMVTMLDLTQIFKKMFKIDGVEHMDVLIEPDLMHPLLDDNRQILYTVNFINSDAQFTSELKINIDARMRGRQNTIGFH